MPGIITWSNAAFIASKTLVSLSRQFALIAVKQPFPRLFRVFRGKNPAVLCVFA